MRKEYEFVKQVADPIKISEEWQVLFDLYMNEKNSQKKISETQIKLRQNDFLSCHRYFSEYF